LRSRSKKAIANISTSLLLQLVTIITGLIIPRLIISSFGSGVNGLISSINQFLSFIVLFEAGVGGVTRAALYKPLANKDIESVSRITKAAENFFRTVGLIFTGYLIVLSLLYPFIVKDGFNIIFTLSLVLIIGISTFVQYFFGITYQILLNADQKQYFNSCLQIIAIVLNSIISVILIKVGAPIHIVKLGSAIIYIAKPIILYIYVNRNYKIIRNIIPDDSAIKQKWDGFGHHISYLIRLHSDIIILTLFANMREISVYSVYFMIINGIEQLILTLSSGLEATFGNILAKEENESLKRNFSIFEFVSYSSTTILYTCTAVLIIPFVKIYTHNITDVDYIRHLFAYLFIAGHALYCIRMPYYCLVRAAGHYKQTKKIAIAEAMISVSVSVILTYKFGIIGVAAGSLCAMLFGMTSYMIYLSNNILKKNFTSFLKRFCICIVNCVLILSLNKILNLHYVGTYSNWVLNAFMITIVAIFVTVGTGIIFYTEDIKNIINIFKTLIRNKIRKQPADF